MHKRLLLVIVGLVMLAGCMVHEEPYPHRAVVLTPDMSPPVFTERPTLILIDGTPGIHCVPDTTVFLYAGSWYYYAGTNWFISVSYTGPWRHVEPERVPVAFKKIPPGHMRPPPGQMKHKDIPPGHRDTDDRKNPPGKIKDKDTPPGHKDKDKDKDDDKKPPEHKKDKGGKGKDK